MGGRCPQVGRQRRARCPPVHTKPRPHPQCSAGDNDLTRQPCPLEGSQGLEGAATHERQRVGQEQRPEGSPSVLAARSPSAQLCGQSWPRCRLRGWGSDGLASRCFRVPGAGGPPPGELGLQPLPLPWVGADSSAGTRQGESWGVSLHGMGLSRRRTLPRESRQAQAGDQLRDSTFIRKSATIKGQNHTVKLIKTQIPNHHKLF